MGTSVAKWQFTRWVWLAGVVLASGGCAGSASDREDRLQEASASSGFSLNVPPEMGAGSVRICGERERPAHQLYPCRSDIREEPSSGDCPCFDLDANGVPQTDSGPLSFFGLCPSANEPEAPWLFSYEIWTEHGCGGTQLNAEDNPNNFRCYDIQDLAEMRHMNQSLEWLDVGYNYNEIICLTRNSTKDWEFQFCEDKTLSVECGPHTTVLDCGCQLAEGQCACPERTLEALPWNCEARLENGCDIWCEGAYPQAEAAFLSFGNAENPKGLRLGAFGGSTHGKAFSWGDGHEHQFELKYDHRYRKLSLSAWRQGMSKTLNEMTLGQPLAELNSLELRLTNYEREAVWIEVSDLKITGRQEPIAANLQAPAFGTRSHPFWIGPLQGNFTVSGRIRIQGNFSKDVGDAARVELLVGRNLANPPGAR